MHFITRLLVFFGLVSIAFAAAKWQDVDIPKSDDYNPRSDCAFGQCGDKLCLLGGRNPDSPEPANLFDTSKNKWDTLAAPDIDMHHFQIASVPDDEDSDCVWCGGAFTGFFPREDVIDNIYKFCPKDGGEWSKGPNIERPRGAGGAVSYKGKYYLISGNVGGHGNHSKVVPWFDSYDPDSKKWTKLPDVPHPRDHFHAAILKNKLYVAGGRDGSATDFFNAVEPAVDVYDFSTGKWSTISDTFPSPRGGTLTTVHGDRIIYGGGEGNGKAYKDVHYFDGEKFVKAPSMITAHHGTSFVSCAGAVWVAGGVSAQAAGPEVKSTEVLSDDSKIPTCTKEKAGSPQKKFDGEDRGDQSDSPSSSVDKACFPSDAIVELQDGTFKKMAQIRIGDKVRVGGDAQYSEIFFFSHRAEHISSEFVRLETDSDNIAISLSANHLVLVNDRLRPARAAKVGDKLSTLSTRSSGAHARINRISKHRGRGLYNPHTLAGDIVVNGVVTSTFTDTIPSEMARILLSPFRAIFVLLGSHPFTEMSNEFVLKFLEALGIHAISPTSHARSRTLQIFGSSNFEDL